MISPQTINPLTLPSLPLEMRSHLPVTSCIYFALDSQGAVQYIGRAINLQKRWRIHHKGVDLALMGGVRIAYLESDTELLPEIEQALIAWFQPPLNGSRRDGEQLNPDAVGIPVSRVAELRKKLDLTQRQLADLVGVTETTIRNWENNRSGVEWFERIAKLCEALQCKPDELIEYKSVEGGEVK